MALDRWIALVAMLVFLVYGYASFFTMDEALPPVLRRNPVWPSSFPKILSVLGLCVSIAIALGLEKQSKAQTSGELDLANPLKYKIGQALALLGMMVLYALTLRSLGFILATFLFLVAGSLILGERRYLAMIITALIASTGIWYLVSQTLGIYLPVMPALFGHQL
ncbi:MAG: tripartite tricarboxylate transporter TctB family protein [Pseudomonadota bacterium]